MRGLKPGKSNGCGSKSSRILTDAWIETTLFLAKFQSPSSRILTDAWIETSHRYALVKALMSRILTDAWIETKKMKYEIQITPVASSRMRGLKQKLNRGITLLQESHPHGCVD